MQEDAPGMGAAEGNSDGDDADYDVRAAGDASEGPRADVRDIIAATVQVCDCPTCRDGATVSLMDYGVAHVPGGCPVSHAHFPV